MRIREYAPEDHAMLATWWEGHDWPVVPQAILPKLGIIVEDDAGQGLCAGWLYMDNSVGVCWLDWVVTNPAALPMACVRSISQLVTFMTDRAVELDYGVMITACRQPTLTRLYQRNGFTVTDRSVTHLIMNMGTD